MYISVVPDRKLVLVDQEPPLELDIDFPVDVHSIYFDTERGEGKLQYADPSIPLEDISYSDIEKYLSAYQKKRKADAKKSKKKTTTDTSTSTNTDGPAEPA